MSRRLLATLQLLLFGAWATAALLVGQAAPGLAQTVSTQPLNSAAGPNVDLLPFVGVDAGFESSTPFASWLLNAKSPSSIVKDATQRVEGVASAKLTAVGAPAQMSCYLPNGFPAQGGRYRLSFWAKTSQTPLQYIVYLSINGADYSLDIDDPANPWKNDVLWNDDFSTASTWTRRSLEFTMPVKPGAQMELILGFKTDSGGTAWLDHVRVDPVWSSYVNAQGQTVANSWRLPTPFPASFDTVYINGQPGNRVSLPGNLARDGDFIRDGDTLYLRNSVNPAADSRKIELGFAPTPTPAPTTPTDPVQTPAGPSHAVSSGADLASKINALGSTTGTVVVRTAISLAGSVTIPANVTLQVDSGGSINRNGKSLTVKGPLKAGSYQIFTGSGTLVGAPKDTGVLPQWFGAKGNGSFNDTAALQSALDFAAGGKVLVPATSSEYRIFPVSVRSNTVVEFASGTKLRALSGYREEDRMFRINDVNNVKIVGNNVMMRMLKAEYRGEQRHVVDIRGGSNIEVTGVNAYDAGGDGFYVGASLKDNTTPARNVTIRNCVSENNRRLGMAVICADGLYVYDSVFRNNIGTDPQSGLDIEPDHAGQVLKNIKFTRCQFYNNAVNGITVWINQLDGRTPISITFDSCKSYGNMLGFNVHYRAVTAGLLSGIKTINCEFTGNSYKNTWSFQDK